MPDLKKVALAAGVGAGLSFLPVGGTRLASPMQAAAIGAAAAVGGPILSGIDDRTFKFDLPMEPTLFAAAAGGLADTVYTMAYQGGFSLQRFAVASLIGGVSNYAACQLMKRM